MSETGKQFRREVYSFWDLIDNIAGIYELIVGTFGLILYTVAKHNFVLRSIQSLFLINTSDPDLINET
jgi:hypothetical protein